MEFDTESIDGIVTGLIDPVNHWSGAGQPRGILGLLASTGTCRETRQNNVRPIVSPSSIFVPTLSKYRVVLIFQKL